MGLYPQMVCRRSCRLRARPSCAVLLLFFITLKPRVESYTTSMSLTYEPASEPLHISVAVQLHLVHTRCRANTYKTVKAAFRPWLSGTLFELPPLGSEAGRTEARPRAPTWSNRSCRGYHTRVAVMRPELDTYVIEPHGRAQGSQPEPPWKGSQPDPPARRVRCSKEA